MRTLQTKLIVIGVVVLGAAIAAWALSDAEPPVSLNVIGFTTNQWSDEVAARFGGGTYICAVVAATNTSTRPFTYWTRYSETSVQYQILELTPAGWKAPPAGFTCGTGLEQRPLSPLHGFTFEAVVKTDKPCKVALSFWEGRTSNRIWQRLPSWLTQKLPWDPGWITATSDAIDLRAP